MFKKMLIHFNNVPTCEIDLNQSEILNHWIAVHIENSKNFGYWIRGHAYAYHVTQSKDYKTIKKTIPKKINFALNQLEELTGIRWPMTASKSMDFEFLNKLHRMFTVSDITEKNYEITKEVKHLLWSMKKKLKPNFNYYTTTLKDNSIYNIDKVYPEFTIFEKTEFHRIIEEINALIHIYEDSVLISDRSLHMHNSINPFYETLIDIDWIYKKSNGTLISSEIKKVDIDMIKSEFYSVNYDYDVYAVKSISGKDYFLAYQQYDDPTEWDITRTSNLTGGITLDPFQLMNKFYNSLEFKNWLDSYNHPYDPELFGNFIIGKISNDWKSCLKQQPVRIIKKSVDDNFDNHQSDLNTLIDDYQIIKIEFRN